MFILNVYFPHISDHPRYAEMSEGYLIWETRSVLTSLTTSLVQQWLPRLNTKGTKNIAPCKSPLWNTNTVKNKIKSGRCGYGIRCPLCRKVRRAHRCKVAVGFTRVYEGWVQISEDLWLIGLCGRKADCSETLLYSATLTSNTHTHNTRHTGLKRDIDSLIERWEHRNGNGSLTGFHCAFMPLEKTPTHFTQHQHD